MSLSILVTAAVSVLHLLFIQLFLQYAIKHLRLTKGNIINIASMAGVHGQEMAMAYGVSKVFLSKSCPA